MKILIGFLLIILGVVVGAVLAYSFPEGFPGAYGPPADQKQTSLKVEAGDLTVSDDWVKGINTYLVPFVGIRGDRYYDALILVPFQGLKLNPLHGIWFVLKGSNVPGLIQPIELDSDDITNLNSNHIVVKLLDEGPNSGQYYKGAKNLTLNSRGPDGL